MVNRAKTCLRSPPASGMVGAAAPDARAKRHQMILLQNGPGGRPALFDAPRAVIRAGSAAEVAPALAQAEQALAAGHWVAGMLAYEAGFALEPALAGLQRAAGPLVHLGVYDAPSDGRGTLARAEAEAVDAHLTAPVPALPRAAHAEAIARALELIRAGDCYQVNLTFPLTAAAQGTPLGLFAALSRVQPVGHGGVVCLPEAPALVSLSPESFFATDAAGGITVRPMKGTRPRHPDPAQDAALAAELRSAVKDRAENLMIVDLMRNDLSRICHVGSVRVPQLFAVESFATVHQMVSEVRGRLLPGTGFADILRAIFPCGSITGAPKIRAMQIIHDLEPQPRGAYCGAIGWAGPDGSSAFNVAIRTLVLHPGGAVTLNVGGGVVADSTAEGEWEEALWKARFARVT